MRADGSGQPQKLTSKPAYYEKPAYSLDGRRIVVGRGPRNMRKDLEELERPPAAGGRRRARVAAGQRRRRNAHRADLELRPPALRERRHDARLLLRGQHARVDALGRHRSEDDSAHRRRWWSRRRWRRRRRRDDDVARRRARCCSRSTDQAGPRVVSHPGNAEDRQRADDQRDEPGAVRGARSQGDGHRRRVLDMGRSDGRQIYYALGHSLFTYDLARGRGGGARLDRRARSARADSTNAGGSAGGGRGGGRGGAPARPIYEATRRDIAITVPKDKPQGTVVLRGARILTMKGTEVIPKGDIVVKDNRIVAVGAQGKVHDSVGREGDRRAGQDDHARLRRHPRAHVAGVRRPPLAAVRVSRQSRVRRDDDARSADVDDRRALVRGHGGDRRLHRTAHSLDRPGRLLSDADPVARRSARRAQEVLGVLQYGDDQAVHGRRSSHAAVHHRWRRASSTSRRRSRAASTSRRT